MKIKKFYWGSIGGNLDRTWNMVKVEILRHKSLIMVIIILKIIIHTTVQQCSRHMQFTDCIYLFIYEEIVCN